MFRSFVFLTFLLSCLQTRIAFADVPLGGFIPLVGMGMTNEFQTINVIDLGGIPFIAEPSTSIDPAFPLLGTGGNAYFDLALLDSGAATHIITQEAFNGFDLAGNNMQGTNIQPVGGATGVIITEINDAGGIYAAGLGDRTAAGTLLDMDTTKLRGQTSVATLTAPAEWTLPNILGLPMAAQHAIAIQNSDPQIFQHDGRTARTPQVEFRDLGSGGDGILRRAPLKLRPGIGFIQGPQYVFNLDFNDILGGGNIAVHDNPASPSVVIDTNGNGGGLFIDVDFANGSESLEDRELLFDTGADLTVVSQITAARLGFDPILDTPDFVLEVEGSGGISTGIPGFYLDELNIDTIGGSFTMQNVPIAVLDVTNPNNPGNIIDGILGMHLFTGRDLVIDANASVGQAGAGPSLYISDPVTETHDWASPAASANWATTTSWSAAGTPSIMWQANVTNVSGSSQIASVTSDSTIFQLTVSGNASNAMSVDIQVGATLTTFGETRIEAGGQIRLNGSGAKIDAQFINIEDGTLTGSGDIFVGTGPIHGAVRNLSGRIEPGAPIGKMNIVGDLSNLENGTIAFDLGGTIAETGHDQIATERFAFLAGTLEVLFDGSYIPSIGDMFTLITSTEGVVGQFDNLTLPHAFSWNIDYLPNSVVLEVLGLAGDFNGDGSALGDDLTTWQSGYGSTYNGVDFLTWQQNYQGVLNAGATIAVPEPGSWILMLCVLLCATPFGRQIGSCTDRAIGQSAPLHTFQH